MELYWRGDLGVELVAARWNLATRATRLLFVGSSARSKHSMDLVGAPHHRGPLVGYHVSRGQSLGSSDQISVVSAGLVAFNSAKLGFPRIDEGLLLAMKQHGVIVE